MKEKKEFLNFLEKCIQKNKDAWDTFVDQYSQLIYNYIIHTLRRYEYYSQNDTAEEIFHTIFLNLLQENCKSLRNFRGQTERSFLAYLKTICFSSTIDHLRRQRRFVDLEVVLYCIPGKNKTGRLHLQEFKEIVKKIKDNLPERHNRLFEMIYEEELDQSEISEIMDLKSNAFYQLKHRMMNNVKKIVKKKDLYQELKIFLMDTNLNKHNRIKPFPADQVSYK